MGMINEVKQAFIDNIQEYPSKETVDISLGIIMVIMEPEDIYSMLLDIYTHEDIEDNELDKYIKDAALFYREVSKPLQSWIK